MTPKPASKQTIAVDIDEVLTPHFQDLINWYNATYNTSLTLLDNHPTDTKNWGTDSIVEAVQRVQKFFETQEFKKSQPFEEAKSAVNQLSRRYKMISITSRDTIIEQLTREWLNQHFPELFKEAHFAAMYSLDNKAKPKAEIARSVGVDFMIDDSLEHITNASKAGIIGLLFGNYPWNQTDELPSGVVRVQNWQAVLDYFDGVS
jgi:uncharacterized HAD superfamily protein